MLGTEAVAGRLTDVHVDVLGSHRSPAAVFVEILKELLARNVLRAAHNACDAAVDQLELPLLARLALKGKTQAGTGNVDMAVAQSCEAKAFVVAGIGSVPNSDHGIVEQPDDGADHA